MGIFVCHFGWSGRWFQPSLDIYRPFVPSYLPLLLLASCALSQRVLIFIHLSPELSPSLSPRCCLVLGGWGSEILSLYCLSRQISCLFIVTCLLAYCRLPLGVFVTHENHVLCRCVLLVFAGVSLAECQKIQDLSCSITRFSEISTKFGYSIAWYPTYDFVSSCYPPWKSGWMLLSSCCCPLSITGRVQAARFANSACQVCPRF